MWMALLRGEHVSTDVAVVDGEPRWWRHVTGKSIDEGMFDYWTVLAERAARDRGLLRRLAAGQLSRLHRHGQLRDDRRQDHRGPPPLLRPMARPVRRRLDRGAGPPLRGRRLGLRRRRPQGRLQRRAVRPARPAVLAPRPGADRRAAEAAGDHQHPDHLPRGQAAEGALDAARRLPPRDRQLLGPRGRPRGPRAPGAPLLGDPKDRPRRPRRKAALAL